VATRLRDAGLSVEVDAGIAAALAAESDSSAALSTAAEERLAAVDRIFAERGGSLYPYQRHGVEWLAPRRTAVLADDMGCGKTVQALIAAPADMPIVVVCPSVAKGVWVREAAVWRPDLSPVQLSGRKSFRWPAPGEMVVTNYAILPPDCGDAPIGTVVICDEAHALKSPKAQRTKRARKIIAAALNGGGRGWLLTATPLLGKPPELRSILAAIGEEGVFGPWPEFVRLFGGYQGRFGVEWGRPKPEAAERLRSVQLRRLKADVLADLPDKSWSVQTVDVDRATLKILDDVPPDVVDKIDASKGGVGFAELSAARAALATGKTPALLELVESYESSATPLVVMSAHRFPVDSMAGREGWAAITGDTPPAERTAIEDRFQRGDLIGVAATIQAGGIAITLTRASTMILVDRDWTPALNSQAEDRIYRIGQENAVQIIDLVADHEIDRRLYEVLRGKQDLITRTVDAAAEGATV
jgi:SNF2 family DNA or RNA helicase